MDDGINIRIPVLSSNTFNLMAERNMPFTPDILYKAWTEQFDLWFADPGSVIMKAEVNSVFFFETAYQGKRYPHYGRFLRLIKPKLVEFTWLTGKGGTDGAETIVTIELKPYDNGALLCLTQKGFYSEEARNRTEEAWPLVFEQMENKLLEFYNK